MMDERLTELMNREIDGENSRGDSEELRRALESDPEARAYYEDLVELGTRFEQAGEVEPSRTLRREIFASTTRGRRPAARGRRSLLPDGLRDLFTPRLAYAFAAGVAIGAVLLALITGVGGGPDALDPAALRGTLAPWDVPARFDAGERLEFDVPMGWGKGCIYYSSSDIWAELSLDTDSETEIVFRHDGDVSFDRLQAVEAGEHAVSTAGGRTTLTHVGVGQYVIVFRDSDESLSPMRVEVYDRGELMYGKTVEPVRE